MKPLTSPAEVVVELANAPLGAEVMAALAEIRVQQRLSLPTQCELRFLQPQGALARAAPLPPGAALRIAVRGHAGALFAGEVTAAEYLHGPAGQFEVRLRGYDRLHRLRKRQPVRSHEQLDVLALARELASAIGLSVEAAEPAPARTQFVQHRQSDLDLLTEALDDAGLFCFLTGDSLQVFSLAGIGPELSLSLGETLLEARVEISGEAACRKVGVAGWNPRRGEMQEAEITQPRSGRTSAACVAPEIIGGDGELRLVGASLESASQAEALAQSVLDRRVAREVTLWGMAEGNPRLQPGARVDVRGLAGPFCGVYVLTAVTHVFNRQYGLLSEFDTTPPAPPPMRTAPLVVLGQVSRVDDPDGLGRVKLTLPAFAGVETEWLPVVAQAAGPDKGLIMLPDVGDRVLALAAGDDPSEAVVVGGLYAPEAPADPGVESGAVRRYTWRTAAGQKVLLDDAQQVVLVETRDGSSLRLAPDLIRLRSAGDLEIEAPGKRIILRGAAIDFQRG